MMFNMEKHYYMCACYIHYYRYNELTIHGLGAAINRAINLALKLQETSPYELKVNILIMLTIYTHYRMK